MNKARHLANPASLVAFEYEDAEGGLTAHRAHPIELWFGLASSHAEAQWFLNAFDVGEEETLTFAMKDIVGWRLAGPA